ncbi:MAG: DUF5074 domain-containing protein [Odoribacter sp.]
MNKIYISILVFALAVGFSACEEDDCSQFHIDTDMMGIPTVLKGTFPLGKQTMTIGDSMVFAPQLLDTTGVAYSWAIDGREVSTDSAFTFRVTKPCRAKLLCTLTNEKGKVMLESEMASRQDFTKGFFVVQEKEIGFYDEVSGKLYADCYQSLNGGEKVTNGSGSDKIFVAQADRKLYAMTYTSMTNIDHLLVVDRENFSGETWASVVNGIVSFIPLNERYAILSGFKAVYRLDLFTMKKVLLSANAAKPIFNGLVFNGKLLVNATYGKELKAAYYDVKELIDAKEGYLPTATELDILQNRKANFVKAKDGNVYTLYSSGTDYRLARITGDFKVETVSLPFQIAKAEYWSTLYFPTLAVSGIENALFIPSADNAVYRYVWGDASSWKKPFVAAATEGESELSGSGIEVDPLTGELYVLYPDRIGVYAVDGSWKKTLVCEENPQAILFNH